MCNISVVCLQLDLKFSLPRAPCCEFSPHLLHLSTRSRPPHRSYRVIVPSLQDGLWDGNRDILGDRAEFLVLKLWLETQAAASVVEEVGE